MPAYRYELRSGDQVVATGYLSDEQPLQVGETLTLGSRSGLVRSIEPQLHQQELQLIVQLRCDDDSGEAPSFAPLHEPLARQP